MDVMQFHLCLYTRVATDLHIWMYFYLENVSCFLKVGNAQGHWWFDLITFWLPAGRFVLLAYRRETGLELCQWLPGRQK